MNKKYTKLVAIFILCAIMVTNASAFVSADDTSVLSEFQTKEDRRLYAVMQDTIKEISDSSIRMSGVKTVYGFDGEEYISVECQPSGYMIYHPASGKFVETSPSAPSPYQGLTGDNLYYGGPTEYYQLRDGKYQHTVINESFCDAGDVELMAENSEQISQRLCAEKNTAVLNYVESGDTGAYRAMSAASASASSGGLSTFQQNWFKGLTENFGYWETGDGVCGFVALNLLIAWFDRFKDDRFMDDKYWIDPRYKMSLQSWDLSLTKYLYDLDPKDWTTSMHIHKVCREYLEERNLHNAVDHTSLYWGLFNNSTMKGFLNSGYPIILFGSLEKPNGQGQVDHAVVAYRYADTDRGVKYTCHYGWPNYSEVTIEGILGSMYGMKLKYK